LLHLSFAQSKHSKLNLSRHKNQISSYYGTKPSKPQIHINDEPCSWGFINVGDGNHTQKNGVTMETYHKSYFKRMDWQWRPITNHISNIQWRGLVNVGGTWLKLLVDIHISALWLFSNHMAQKSSRAFAKHFVHCHVVKKFP
jgi:hypothetical protein